MNSTIVLLCVLLFCVATGFWLWRYIRAGFACSPAERASILFDAAPCGMVVLRSDDGVVLDVNRTFETISGFNRETLIGHPLATTSLWADPGQLVRLAHRLRTEGAVHQFKALFCRADGNRFTGKVSASTLDIEGVPGTIAFIEDITEQHEIARKVEELTRFDPLTGLPNQKLLAERLEQLLATANREEQGLAVLHLAMNRCPCSVMASGHDGCDELLRSISTRLQEVLRQTDTLAMLQKGEFCILLPRLASERELLPVLGKLMDCINTPITLADAEYQLYGHIGIATFPGDGRTGEALQQQARMALSQAQTHSGESFFQFYAEELNQLALEQLQIESSMLRGIRSGEFFACYQPIFSGDGRQLVAMEALARWQHPLLGLVGPDKFIPVAEANGTIVPLGERIMELALQNCRYWRENGHPQLTVSVNVSTRQLKDRSFSQRVARLLQSIDIPAEALCCELTESLFVEHSNENTEQIFRLKELGVRLAIDDFGTGYSSLSYLKHLPVDYLKIDRSFIRDLDSNPDDRAIVTAVVAMARSLHLKVVVEGVETARHQQLLQELDCDLLQGYFFGKPMPRSDFEAFLQRTPPVVGDLPPAVATAATENQPVIQAPAQPPEEERSLQHVADMTLQIPPLRPADRLNTALDRFQTDKRLQVLPVVEQQQVVGILNRSEFIEEQVVGRIGYAFHINHSKKVRDLMLPVPLVIDAEAGIDEAARLLHGNAEGVRLENICVARRGDYLGVLDVRTLVEAITALNLKLAKGANPLTGLPGNESIQREITRRLAAGLPFEIAYLDIDNFKPYNDYYGFERGDLVIQMVAEILRLHGEGNSRNFCGHIGGDDFILITGPGSAVALGRQILREFEFRLPLLHGSGDFARGCYTTFNRKGELETFRLLSISVAIINTAGLQVTSYAQLASMASEVKKSAKKVKGSSVVYKDKDDAPTVIDNLSAAACAGTVALPDIRFQEEAGYEL